jgi:outer membrane protein assembly factor BamB
MSAATRRLLSLAAALLPLLLGLAGAGNAAPAPKEADTKTSWPMFGGTPSRNMANPFASNIPSSWSVEDGKHKNVKWVVDLGTESVGGFVIAGGRVFVGTNNKKPRDSKITDRNGVLMCFRESDGQFLWQALHEGHDDDDSDTGVSSTPCVDGDRLYYMSNRCELVCADVEGDPKTGKAKIVWTLDMRKELKVAPGSQFCPLHHAVFSSPLVLGDLVFVNTGHGVDKDTKKVANADAPSFIAVHKQTGKVAWQDSSPGKNILDVQWGSPAAAEVKGVTQVIFPGGDGWLYAFEARTGKLIWKFDCNSKGSVYLAKGRGARNFILATPVVYDKKVYIGTGRAAAVDVQGIADFWCIDITKEPKNKDKDLSPVNDNFDPKAAVNKDSGLVWHFGGMLDPKPKRERAYKFGRTMSTACAHEGLIYVGEIDGYLHCFDARTGEKYWTDYVKDEVCSSPYYVDGKVYFGTTSGNVLIYLHGKVKKQLAEIDSRGLICAPVVAVNGVLYVNNGWQLVAVSEGGK